LAYKPFQDGDIIWGPDAYPANDPFLRGQGLRPWLVLSTDAFPRQGEDYLCCALTSNTARSEHLVPIEEPDWEKRGALKPSQVDPQTLMTMKHEWVARYTGRVAHRPLARAKKMVQAYIGPPRK
jgi:mRNA-degrading endonuclease toxin of MazEF toxin-antitoxin module